MKDNFYTQVLMRDQRFKSDKLCNGIALLEPGTREAVRALVAEAKAQGHDLRVGETFRSQARQHKVFMAGASKLSKVGMHGFGLAADLQLFVKGKYIADGGVYAFLVGLCGKHGLISGIDWGEPNRHHDLIDSGHVQRCPKFRQDAIFSQAWYPPVVYNPWQDMQANGVH